MVHSVSLQVNKQFIVTITGCPAIIKGSKKEVKLRYEVGKAAETVSKAIAKPDCTQSSYLLRVKKTPASTDADFAKLATLEKEIQLEVSTNSASKVGEYTIQMV